MFRRWREKLERALARREAERVPTREDFDRILSGMRDELIDMKARLPRVEKQAERVAAAARSAMRRAEERRGRAEEARKRGDAEAVRGAMSAAERALAEAEDLHRQAAGMRTEAARLRREVDEKMDALKEAHRNRDVLLARARRADTSRNLKEMLRGPESGLERLERMEEEIQAAEDRVEASRELEEALEGRPALPETEWELEKLEAAETADEIDRRLEALRREIREEDE